MIVGSGTKDKEIQAFIWQIFIDQHFLFSLSATSQEPNEISVLEFGNQSDFIFELAVTLSRM